MNRGEVVPINVQITPEIRVVAITGPNTGGKNRYFKNPRISGFNGESGLVYSSAGTGRDTLVRSAFSPISEMNSLCNRVYRLFRVTFAGLSAF
jgi:hypothetical protein